jgi:hypothetical protein
VSRNAALWDVWSAPTHGLLSSCSELLRPSRACVVRLA